MPVMLVSIDVPHLGEILIEECLAEAAAGIGEQRVDRPAADRGAELVDAVGGGKIGLDGLDAGAEPAQIVGRRLDLGLVRRDDKVEAFWAQHLASSRPMPVEAPVTTAS